MGEDQQDQASSTCPHNPAPPSSFVTCATIECQKQRSYSCEKDWSVPCASESLLKIATTNKSEASQANGGIRNTTKCPMNTTSILIADLDRRVSKSRLNSENLLQPLQVLSPANSSTSGGASSNSPQKFTIPSIVTPPQQRKSTKNNLTISSEMSNDNSTDILNYRVKNLFREDFDLMTRKIDSNFCDSFVSSVAKSRQNQEFENYNNYQDNGNNNNNYYTVDSEKTMSKSLLRQPKLEPIFIKDEQQDETTATIDRNKRPSESEDSALPPDSLAGSSQLASPTSSSSSAASMAAIQQQQQQRVGPRFSNSTDKGKQKFRQVRHGVWETVAGSRERDTLREDVSQMIIKNEPLAMLPPRSVNRLIERFSIENSNLEVEASIDDTSTQGTARFGLLDFSRFNDNKIIGRSVRKPFMRNSSSESETEQTEQAERTNKQAQTDTTEACRPSLNTAILSKPIVKEAAFQTSSIYSPQSAIGNANIIKPIHIKEEPEDEAFFSTQPTEVVPTQEELDAIRDLLGPDECLNFEIITVKLPRPKGVLEGGVGILLTQSSVEGSSSKKQITISSIVKGSIADREGRLVDWNKRLVENDRVFFIQSQSTRDMNVAQARSALKAKALFVSLVVGRKRLHCLSSSSTYIPVSTSNLSECSDDTFTSDPANEEYSIEPITVVLRKSDHGVGLSMEGGRESKFGDRPIVVKKVYSAGEAAKDGRIAIGDEIRLIDGTDMRELSRFKAMSLLKKITNGPVEFVIYKRLVKEDK